jgi:alkylation response protein AidB-like acyl-CoA dehydrogenase
VVEVVVANRLLAACGVEPDPAAVTTIAVRTAVDGVARLVPGGAVATSVVALDGGRLVRLDVTPSDGPRNLGNAPLADLDLAGATELAHDATAFDHALDEWRALTAIWLHGLGRAALDIGIQYAKDRQQFGVPIGSFQSVQHRFADLHTDLDGTWLLANKAVWALDEGEAIGPQFASSAFTFSGETAEKAAAAALHYHGGYGFMEEYDIQLYFRRAKAARLVLGDPRAELQVLADRLFGPIEGDA